MTLPVKVRVWKTIIQSKSIQLSHSVEGKTIYIIDDLYQSGATLWSYAKYLKAKGANTVIGLVCVKALSDKDNQ